MIRLGYYKRQASLSFAAFYADAFARDFIPLAYAEAALVRPILFCMQDAVGSSTPRLDETEPLVIEPGNDLSFVAIHRVPFVAK